MKIAHIMAGAPTGGAELFYERLVAAMQRTGDDILPIIRRNPAREARLTAAGLTPIPLRFGGAFDLLTRPRIARHLRAFAPTHVMPWMSRAAAMTPPGKYVLIGRLGGAYDLRRFRHCDHLVANTQGLVDWIKTQGWPPARVHHLPNFVPDFSNAPPAPLPVPRNAPTLLAMGRLHRNKGFDTLIHALRHLPGVHAVIAGEGPERPALQTLAHTEGVADRVHLLGWRHDQAALLAAAAILVVPSRIEPLGNVILEGFSAGIPIVAAAAAGPRETIRPNETGLLTPIDDAIALAEAIAEVLANPTLATRLAQAARAEFEAHHAQPAIIPKWRHLLPTLDKT